MRKFLILIHLFISYFSFSQEHHSRFNLILSGGFAATQVDGDSYSGYNKIGLNGGIFINNKISDPFSWVFGITYIQKGSRSNATLQNPNYYLLKLNYVEIPLLFVFNYKLKYRVELGVSSSFLFNSFEENAMVGAFKGALKKQDWCYNIGLGYKLNNRCFLNARYNYSFLPFREYNKNVYLGNFWQRTFNKGLYNNCLLFSINYILSPEHAENK